MNAQPFFIILSALILFGMMQSPCAHAGSVEVNLDALDNGAQEYDPPRMFDPKNAPLTGHGSSKGQVEVFPLDIRTNTNTVNPGVQHHQSVIIEPVKPAQPPKPARQEKVEVLLPPLESAEEKFFRELYEPPPAPKAPIPKHKPGLKMQAVLDKLATAEPAAKQAGFTPPIPKRRPAKFHASKKFIKEAIAARQDAIAPGKLAEPTAQEVFESIEEQKPVIEPSVPQSEPAQSVSVGSKGDIISLIFQPGSADIDGIAKEMFDQQAIKKLRKDPDLRVQLQSYALPTGDGQSSARRLSLSRAIAIRAYLIEKNIDPKRIDIRALGNQTDIQPPDRVDLIFIKKNEML